MSAGLDTVAIRMPDKKLTRDLISLVASPLAAPSASISGRPSPTSAKAVLADMDGRIEAILDGGDSKIGIESTALDLSVSPVKILRPGYDTQEILEEYFGQVDLDLALKDKDQTPKSLEYKKDDRGDMIHFTYLHMQQEPYYSWNFE